MVPNEDLITSKVINYTHSDTDSRIEITIGVAYSSDLDLVKKLILEAALEHPRTLKDPQPNCFLREFADSSVNFLLHFWIGDVDEGRFGPQSEVMFDIWNKFKENDIEIPFPQRDIHIKENIK
jgi:small-conductance mechanosensitive channel